MLNKSSSTMMFTTNTLYSFIYVHMYVDFYVCEVFCHWIPSVSMAAILNYVILFLCSICGCGSGCSGCLTCGVCLVCAEEAIPADHTLEEYYIKKTSNEDEKKKAYEEGRERIRKLRAAAGKKKPKGRQGATVEEKTVDLGEYRGLRMLTSPAMLFITLFFILFYYICSLTR